MPLNKKNYIGIGLVALTILTLTIFRCLSNSSTQQAVHTVSQSKSAPSAPIVTSASKTVTQVSKRIEPAANGIESNWLNRAAEVKAMSHSPGRNRLLVELISEWSKAAPKECVLFCESFDAYDPVKKRVCSIALLNWLSSDSYAAESHVVDRISADRAYSEYYVAPITGWFLENTSSGASLLRAFLLKLPQEEQIYVQLLEPIGSALRKNPDRAAELVGISPFASHKEVLDSALNAILTARGGFDYLNNLVTKQANGEALINPILSQQLRDADATSRWLVAHKNDSVLDAARSVVVEQDLWKDPERALVTAMSITDEPTRRKAVESAFVVWLRDNSEQARQWALGGHVPSEWLSSALEGKASLPPRVSRYN